MDIFTKFYLAKVLRFILLNFSIILTRLYKKLQHIKQKGEANIPKYPWILKVTRAAYATFTQN